MDTLRGNFDSSDLSDVSGDYDDLVESENSRELPPEAIGQDERRMQVRAYNHWASQLDDRNFPNIEDLSPENITDFGPYSVLLDFSAGIDDPIVQFLGETLAQECGTNGEIGKLSDVPSRSLLSRITDHYMQILANQAPIGFEAEFVNQRGSTILYRGILLPYSSNDETIDFIYGVINWKEMADQVTADELLLEIDQALEEEEDTPVVREADPVTDWADGPAAEEEVDAIADLGADGLDDMDVDEDEDEDGLPTPEFGHLLNEGDGDDDEDNEANYDFASLTDHVSVPDKKAEAIDLEGVEALLPEGDDMRVEAAFDAESFEADALGANHFDGEDIDAENEAFADTPADNDAGDDHPADTDTEGTDAEDDNADIHVAGDNEEGFVAIELDDEFDNDAGLYDCLASARELAANARTCEDRSRGALYAAVGRAYDFSVAALDAPEDYDQLVAENGLSVQERAPMTPVVKLVFGADYDKTRLTEYAAVLNHAHRLRLERGSLADFLADADGGLKGVVNAERRLRREESGKDVEPVDAPRAALAKKLRAIEPSDFADISPEGAEFALVMIRRTDEGEIVVLGEIDEDIPLIERAGRKLVA